MFLERQGFTVITEVDRDRLPELRAKLARVEQDPAGNPDVPLAAVSTHFATFVILDRECDRQQGYPPLLVFDANHDGSRREYIDALVAASPGLRAIYEHASGFDARSGDLARFLRRHIVRASGAHLGYPGRTVRGVAQDAELRHLVTAYLDSPKGRSMRASGPSAKDAQDTILDMIQAERRGKPHLTTAPSQHEGRFTRYARIAGALPLALPAVLVLVGLAFSLRVKEWLGDPREKYAPPTHPEPGPGEVIEDVQVQNHLTHLVTVRPGVRRALTLRLVLFVVDQLSRVWFNQGALGGIPTIHFARWVILRGGLRRPDRLLFLSNYDLSWDSYLGDFIDRAHKGLTGVWSNTRGFPPTRWIIGDGARHEDAFKAWTRRHQLPEQVWYSSCPQQTVASVLADAALRDGLERELDEATARSWLTRL